MLGIEYQLNYLIKWSIAKEKKDKYFLQCYSEEPFLEKYSVACLDINGVQPSESRRRKCIDI